MGGANLDHGLVIVPAGAGAGKTHRIKTQLSDWVERRIVQPERILAVTFTEAAAGELRERIRAGLLADGHVAEAMAVERAYVSTIHGMGLRFLTEHALASGASLQPRHLGDAERDLLIRQALAQAKSLDPIKSEPEKFGYKVNWQKGETVEDSLRARVLAMIDLLRGLGEKGRDPDLIKPALDRLDAIYGPTLTDPKGHRDQLFFAVTALLAEFPEGGMSGVTAKGPRERLEKDLALFRRVESDPSLLDSDWGLWQALRNPFTSNSRTKTPSGYDELAQAIRDAAAVLPTHPGPLRDAKIHLHCLVACAQEVMGAYEERKKALGLIDYADMISGAERLLRTDEAVRQAVLDEIDCVIIDEFQDTNPVQFALLWQLGARAPRTLLVGDVKQSIMGFQGADPRLSQALAMANPDATQPLDRNWRSSPAVMQFVNAMGSCLFGDHYNALAPTRDPVPGPALEVLLVSKGRTARKFSKPQEHIAERISEMLCSGEFITDRHTKAQRSVRPSDIAVLVCRHTTAARYAEELRVRGVPVRISEDGWFSSAVVRAACAALGFAANPADTNSALVLRTLGPDPLHLQEAMTAQIEGRLLDDPVLQRLSALSERIAQMPVSAALEMVIESSGLRLWAESQPDSAQARADLLRLEAEASEFEAAHRDLKAAAGFHGETLKVFLGWLEARTAERDFDRRPNPAANSAEAVEIVTWHASKGREWPITVVAEFDNQIEERPGSTSSQFATLDNIDDMAAVLSSAVLVHTPGFAAPEATRRFVEDRREDFEANAKNLLYVALTRARDRLLLEWPAFLKDREADAAEANCLFHVFTDACAPVTAVDMMRVGAVDCPAVVRQMPDQADCTQYNAEGKTDTPRFGHADPLPITHLTPWRLQPSQATASSPSVKSRGVHLSAPWSDAASSTLRGTAVHLAMRTYLVRPDLSERLPMATGLDETTLSLVRDRALTLKTWLNEEGYSELLCEVPLLGHSPEGAEIPGIIDLLALGANGALLIDHKTGGQGEGVRQYWPQLSVYADLVRAAYPEKNLNGAGIFWVDHGRLDLVDLIGEAGPLAEGGAS